MTWIAAAIALAALLLPTATEANDGGSPAGAPFEKIVEHEFHAPVPCTVVCPYWVEDDEAACAPEPLAVPPPIGMYDDWDFSLTLPEDAPVQGFVFLVFAISPAMDHDGWMCLQEAHPDNPDRYFLEWSSGPEFCGTVPIIGCREKGEINVCTDKTWLDDLEGFNWACVPRDAPVRFRDYNWADAISIVPAWVCWSKEGIKPDGGGCAGAPG